MNKKICLTLVIILILGMLGCAGIDYVKDAPDRVTAADWSKTQTVVVSLEEYKFVPSQLVFKINIPYKLDIKNNGNEKHYFVSEDFFRAIALRKVQSLDGEIKAPYLTAVEVYPGRTVELYFIPVKDGIYDLVCTIEGHAKKGMVGKIRIEESVVEIPKGMRPMRPYSY